MTSAEGPEGREPATPSPAEAAPPPPPGCRERLESAPFAVLATFGPGHRIDLVPCCFAVLDRSDAHGHGAVDLVTAVDHKPKRHQRLARLANVAADPEVGLLVDHRDPDDWGSLWWIRVQGSARITEAGADHEAALDALAVKYPQYRQHRPEGPALHITPRRWAQWQV